MTRMTTMRKSKIEIQTIKAINNASPFGVCCVLAVYSDSRRHIREYLVRRCFFLAQDAGFSESEERFQ